MASTLAEGPGAGLAQGCHVGPRSFVLFGKGATAAERLQALSQVYTERLSQGAILCWKQGLLIDPRLQTVWAALQAGNAQRAADVALEPDVVPHSDRMLPLDSVAEAPDTLTEVRSIPPKSSRETRWMRARRIACMQMMQMDPSCGC